MALERPWFEAFAWETAEQTFYRLARWLLTLRLRGVEAVLTGPEEHPDYKVMEQALAVAMFARIVLKPQVIESCTYEIRDDEHGTLHKFYEVMSSVLDAAGNPTKRLDVRKYRLHRCLFATVDRYLHRMNPNKLVLMEARPDE